MGTAAGKQASGNISRISHFIRIPVVTSPTFTLRNNCKTTKT